MYLRLCRAVNRAQGPSPAPSNSPLSATVLEVHGSVLAVLEPEFPVAEPLHQSVINREGATNMARARADGHKPNSDSAETPRLEPCLRGLGCGHCQARAGSGFKLMPIRSPPARRRGCRVGLALMQQPGPTDVLKGDAVLQSTGCQHQF